MYQGRKQEERREERRLKNSRKTMRRTKSNAESLWRSSLREKVLGTSAIPYEIFHFIDSIALLLIKISLFYVLMKYRIERKRQRKGFCFLLCTV